MGFLEDRDLETVPSITEFYKGKSIFITGGSGFLGKLLIEKLLYSCSEVDRIYILIRSKKSVKSEDRLAQIYSCPCFDRLRKEKPTIFKSKVFIVAGDVTEPGLGLSEENRTLLVNHVNIIFHAAASIRFDDTLKYAVNVNLRGTIQMLELAKEIRNLSAFVHVSTAYSNTNRDPIEEIMYPVFANVQATLAICENMDEETLRILTPKYLGEVPNTYAFAKQLSEHVVYETKGQIPVVIIRPSVVVASHLEPIPGWIGNFNGPFGILMAGGKGILRTLYSRPNIVTDYIPVDVCIKSFLVAAWLRGTKSLERTDDAPIYNCCVGKLNNITYEKLIDIGYEVLWDIPVGASLWYRPNSFITTSKTSNYIQVILFHLIPAIFIDILLRVVGRKPMLVKIQRRIYIATMALEYYSTNQWTFDNKNFIKLRSCIKDEDLKSFYYDIECIDQYKFIRHGMIGARRYLLHQKDEDLPKDRIHFGRLYVLDKIVRLVFWGFVLWWLANLDCVKNVFNKSI